MEKLISMTDFVLNEQKKCNNDPGNYGRGSLILIWNYANFLKQSLTLGMFVPAKFVNGEWIILKEPNKSNFGIWIGEYEKRLKEYQEAKDRVFFEGFEIIKKETHNLYQCKLKNFDFVSFWNKGCELGWYRSIGIKTVEDLVKYNLILTESAKKQILGS